MEQMIGRVLQFVRLPLVLLVIYAAARFSLGLAGVPYAPRGNAMVSVVGLTIISSIYFGALSGKVGGFGWAGTVIVGICIGFAAELLIFAATLISYVAHLNTYFVHWDALNVPEGTVVPMSRAMASRAGGLIAGSIIGTVFALVGRALSVLAPTPAT
jgi:hypothetical protein